MVEPTPKDVQHAHESSKYSADVISEAFDISVAEVYRLLAEHHKSIEDSGALSGVDISALTLVDEAFEKKGTSTYEVVSGEDFRNDESVITPLEDIDVMHDVDNLRMERMSKMGLHLAGYTSAETEPDYRYWISCIHGELYIHREINNGLGSTMDGE